MTGPDGLEAEARLGPARVASALRHFPPVCFLLLVTALAVLPPLLRAGPSPDELSWGRRSLLPWWFPLPRVADRNSWTADYRQQYTYCIHHPAFARIVYSFILHRAGFDEPPRAVWKYGASYAENIRLGNCLPPRMRLVLRLANAAFFAAAILVAYFGVARILLRRSLAVVAVLPIVLEPTMRIGYKGVVPYVGADALFIFLLVLFWFVWLLVKDRPLAAVFCLGLVGGLATSTKLNGSFVLLAAIVYYLAVARGVPRFAVPLGVFAVASAVFLALNPVYFGAGLPWALSVFNDTLSLMFRLRDVTTATSWGGFTPTETLLGSFPHAIFFVPVAVLVWRLRTAPWLPLTFAWAASIILCNLCFIYMPQPRYAAPVRVACFILVMTAGLALFASGPAKPLSPAGAAPPSRQTSGGSA